MLTLTKLDGSPIFLSVLHVVCVYTDKGITHIRMATRDIYAVQQSMEELAGMPGWSAIYNRTPE